MELEIRAFFPLDASERAKKKVGEGREGGARSVGLG